MSRWARRLSLARSSDIRTRSLDGAEGARRDASGPCVSPGDVLGGGGHGRTEIAHLELRHGPTWTPPNAAPVEDRRCPASERVRGAGWPVMEDVKDDRPPQVPGRGPMAVDRDQRTRLSEDRPDHGDALGRDDVPAVLRNDLRDALREAGSRCRQADGLDAAHPANFMPVTRRPDSPSSHGRPHWRGPRPPRHRARRPRSAAPTPPGPS